MDQFLLADPQDTSPALSPITNTSFLKSKTPLTIGATETTVLAPNKVLRQNEEANKTPPNRGATETTVLALNKVPRPYKGAIAGNGNRTPGQPDTTGPSPTSF